MRIEVHYHGKKEEVHWSFLPRAGDNVHIGAFSGDVDCDIDARVNYLVFFRTFVKVILK